MILVSRFWILDCGLKQHESHCRKRKRGEASPGHRSSIGIDRRNGTPRRPGHVVSKTAVHIPGTPRCSQHFALAPVKGIARLNFLWASAAMNRDADASHFGAGSAFDQTREARSHSSMEGTTMRRIAVLNQKG